MAGQWRGGLVGAGLIGAGIFVAPEVSEWLRDRRERAEADHAVRELLGQMSIPVPAGGLLVAGAARRGCCGPTSGWWDSWTGRS